MDPLTDELSVHHGVGVLGGTGSDAPETGERTERGISSVLQRAWPLLLSLLGLTVGLGILQILLGVRASQAGFHDVTIGVLMSAYFVGYLIASRVVPNIIGQVGHFRTFAALAAAFAASTLVHPIVVDVTVWTALRVVEGFCLAGVFVVTESWLNGHSTNANRGSVLGTYSVLVFGGMAAGQLVLNASPSAGGFRLFSLVAVLACLAVVPVSLSRQPSAHGSDRRVVPLSRLWRGAPLAVVAAAASGLASGALLTIGAVYGVAAGLTVAQTTVMLALALLMGVVALIPIGRLSDRLDRRVMIAATTGVAAAAAATAALVDVPRLAAVLIALVAVHGACSFPQYSLALAHLHDRLDDGERAGASGTIVMAQGAAAAVGPLLAALALTVGPPATFLWFLAGVYAVVSVYALYRISSRASVDSQTTYEPVPTGTTPVISEVTPDELDEGPASETGELEVEDGDLHFRRVGDHGTPIVIVHDLASTSAVWERQAVALAHRHHVVVAHDLRGHGGSSWASEYPVGRHVSDCRALIEQVAGGPAHLVGHGWSAGLVALVAHHHPDLVRSLTLVSPVDELAPPKLVRQSMAHLHRAVEYTTWRARGRAKLARRFATSVYDPELHPDGHALLEADARRADPRCVLAARRELAACVPQAQVGLACPVLVVVGGNISRAHSDAMHALADGFGPDRLRIVEGAGHFVQLDAPAVLERAIVDHVERVDHARGDSWLPLVPEQV